MSWMGIILLLIPIVVLLAIGLVCLAVLSQGIRQLLTGSPPALPLPNPAVRELVRLASLRPGQVVYDLGCGSGRLLLALHLSQPQARLVGLDYDPLVLLRARWRLRGQGADLHRENVLTADLSGADVVVCYLNRQLMARLEVDLERRLNPGSRLISADYPLLQRRVTKTIHIKTDHPRGRSLYLYQF